jgi:hypothetical protein
VVVIQSPTRDAAHCGVWDDVDPTGDAEWLYTQVVVAAWRELSWD